MRLLAASLLLAAALMAMAACGGDQPPAPTATTRPATATATPRATAPTPTPGQPVGDLIAVSLQDPGGGAGHDYRFVPSEFEFKVGQTVTFSLKSETEFHTFTVDDLGIDASVDAGKTQMLTFTFNKAGEFKLVCIPHETLGMVGKIEVES